MDLPGRNGNRGECFAGVGSTVGTRKLIFLANTLVLV
jgi:hypothetical protein